MHTIEPHYQWLEQYEPSSDPNSPFFLRQYSEFEFTNRIYNYLLHPRWDNFGSDTLLIKVLMADYDRGYAIIEMIGEWNDAINNDIMMLKRDVIDPMIDCDIDKFILIGENVLNFHGSDDSYYEEWRSDIPDGWIALLNFQDHVLNELDENYVSQYFEIEDEFLFFPWRTQKPEHVFKKVQNHLSRRIGNGISNF